MLSRSGSRQPFQGQRRRADDTLGRRGEIVSRQGSKTAQFLTDIMVWLVDKEAYIRVLEAGGRDVPRSHRAAGPCACRTHDAAHRIIGVHEFASCQRSEDAINQRRRFHIRAQIKFVEKDRQEAIGLVPLSIPKTSIAIPADSVPSRPAQPAPDVVYACSPQDSRAMIVSPEYKATMGCPATVTSSSICVENRATRGWSRSSTQITQRFSSRSRCSNWLRL